MFSEITTKRQFPDFLISKRPIPINVVSLKFANNIYWMSSVVNDSDSESFQQNYLRPYEDNEEGLLDCCDTEENYDILLTKSGKFMTSFYVPSSLLSFIIGSKGIKLKNLQKITNTLIKVPKPNEKGNIKVTGDTERKVASARTQISMIVMQQRDKLPIKQILRQPPRGVTQSVFQKPEKLHLTMCALTLVDDQEVHTAQKVLQNCYDDFISHIFKKNEKHLIIIQGLEIMNDDPSEVNILYGNVHMGSEQNEKLQNMAAKISEYYYKAGLARRQYDRVKLHVTLMNTNFRNADEKCEHFDATYILEKFHNYKFGVVNFTSIQLSIRFTSGDDKYYDSALTIDI
ncbi:hypothetical protein NQ314_021151 [Rhamnusium bicolor]|uniref:K Homology domain-containing protein n=1 Tax=Rhamnusium bicolor TaxID=1586634 RepID=A0AAV8WIE8_9CUCU|nr:hypothetical protein NQ314_021151 [Rhamnusium bicolor]